MHKLVAVTLSLLNLTVASASRLQAQSITVTPANPYVAVTKTVQFTAQVTGIANQDVIWKAGGVIGGSTSTGKITTAGLYTAPATLPGQNPVYVTATSKINSAVSGGQYVNILSAGPTITSVTPNPISKGTINVVVTGTGIKANAVVFITYGSNNMIQMSTTSTTSTTVKATGYLGPATSATFCIKNPGSDYSNSITIPVQDNTPPPDSHTLTVINGTGSGSYTSGTVVTIKANNPPAGQQFMNWSGAAVANANAATTTLTMPAANVSVTANFGVPGTYALTVINGSGSGSYLPGTVVNITANAPPAGQVFVSWTGASVQNPNSAATTLTMSSASATVTANFAFSAVIPYPVSTHPRLWMTINDLPKLRGWASNTNPIYSQGIKPLLNQCVSIYNNQYFPGGVQNPNYPDPGDVQGYSMFNTEHVAAVLAFNSLIDPDPNARILYAKYARNMIMVLMNQAALGHLSVAPFRDPLFAVYNRANGQGELWPLIVDWIYTAQDTQGNAILTPADKLTIRSVFMMWANDCLNAYTTGGDHPAPIGVTNSTQLLPNNQPYRMAANNYYLGHARLLTMMSLSIDPGDDPLINAAAPASQTGNTLRSYILNANGAWLYQMFAMFGDPSTVANAYGIPGNGAGFGLASGGLPPEGMLYGHSFSYILGQLLALQTAGFNSVANSGPQIGLIGAPIWDRFVQGYMTSLVPAAKTDPSQPWMGPVFQYGSYGDVLRLWATPDSMQPFALLSLLEQQNGSTKNRDAARWFAVNAAEGGPSALMTRITNPWSYGTTDALLYFLLLDPTLPAAPDPRPAMPTTFYDAPAGRIVSHSDWSPMGTMFDYRASWISINHQLGDAGQFELYRKGEWLTKEMSNYDNNALGMTTTYHNTLALQNWCANGTPNLNWYENGEWTLGSQWMLGLNAGDPVTTMSVGQNYVYANSDLTKLYNRPNVWTPVSAAMDITQATRSILWINNDYIVVYDRAASIHSGLFKKFNLSLTNSPVLNGGVLTETLNSGQKLFIQPLLPANRSLNVFNGAANMNPIALFEPSRFILTIEDPAKPSNVRFLNVLQGADAGAPMVPAAYFQSIAGTAFDGAVFGNTAVYFPVNTGGIVATTSFGAPSGVHTLMVTGLAPGTAYGVSIQPSGTGQVITITPGVAGTNTDAAGVLNVVF